MNGEPSSSGNQLPGQRSLFVDGSSSTSTSAGHAQWLMAELASAKTQEQCLMQILNKCGHYLNKLKVEEMQLQIVSREERHEPGGAIQNGVLTPSSILSVNSTNADEAEGGNSRDSEMHGEDSNQEDT